MGRESIFKSLPHLLLLFLISLLLIFFEDLGWTKFVHATGERGTKPVKLTFYRGRQKIISALSFLTFWRSGTQKIKYLEQRNLELLVEAQKSKALEEENNALRAQLQIPLPSSWKLEPAQTLGKTRYLAIDKGDKAGIKIGQIVIFQNILIGKVVKVNPFESQIELPTDPDSKIPVRTLKTRAQGLLTGQFGEMISFEKVTQEERLELGDLVLTSGEGGYPKGLIIGKITKVEKKESEVFQKAEVEPSLNFDELELVFLLKT